MNVLPYGTTTTGEISRIESMFNMKLPEDYKTFLLTHNGGKPEVRYAEFYVKFLNKNIPLDILYGIGLSDLDITEWSNFFPGDIPPKTIVIGGDPGGAMLLLTCAGGEDDGIFYYDHAYFHEESSDECNTYFIANTFTEFIDSLKGNQTS